jgi:Tfp pilus assembly protein PilF
MPASTRCFSFALAATFLFLSPMGRAQQPAPAPASAPVGNSTLTGPTEGAQKLIAEAIKKMNANDVDGALRSLSQAITLNPNATGAFVLRASIYCQKKQWAQAEDDFKTAARIAPTNIVLKFNLVEVKFMQGLYDVARPGFVNLTKDPDVIKNSPEMVDFASYKVFLCDLLGGHLPQAQKELDVFNDTMGNPSYYFSNAAWDLVHKKDINDAREWLLSASRIYTPEKNAYYAQSLRTLGYLPIPSPDDVVTPPGAKPAASLLGQ